MSKTYILSIFFAGILATLSAQTPGEEIENYNHGSDWSSDSLLNIVELNNKTLISARRILDARILEAKTGNSPSDPSIEFGYLSGFPSSIGKRVDFRVEQEFEFPTAYIQLAKTKDLKEEEAHILFHLSRQEVLLRAKKLFIDRVYLNKAELMLSERLLKAEKLQAHYRSMHQSGEVSKLSLSQSNLQTLSLRAELENVRMEMELNNKALEELSGGAIVDYEEREYYEAGIPDVSDLENAYAKSLEMQYYLSQTKQKVTGKALAVSRKLPQFSAAYYSETVISERFRGLSVGLSIPLWEQANTVKLAKAEVLYAESETDRYKNEMELGLAQNLARMYSLQKQLFELEEAIAQVNDEELLNLALNQGEISLSEYIYSSELYFQNAKKVLEYERDLKFVEAELMKVYY